jgi:O-antigen/teichoic acid export membrane protein
MRRIHPLVRDFLVTAITQGGVFGSTLLVIAVIGRLLGSAQLSEYLLLRRVLGWFISAGLLGLGIAQPRYVAISSGRNGAADSRSYFLAATIILTSIAVLAILILNAFSAQAATLLFGNAALTNLVFPLSMAILAWQIHAAVYGYYRGKSQMGQANTLQLVNLAIVPLLSVVLLRKTGVEEIVIGIAFANLLSSILFGAPIFARMKLTAVREVRSKGVEMLRYGLPRVLGDVAAGGNAALAPIIAAHFVSIAAVGPLLLGMSITTAVGLSVAPIGLVLLSKFSRAVAQDQTEQISAHIAHLALAVIQISVFICFQIAAFADVIVQSWVGKDFSQNFLALRLVIFSMPCYLFWVALRNAIDAASVYAYNGRNCLVSLVIFCASAALAIVILNRQSIVDGIAIALLVSYAALAFLTAQTIRKLYSVKLRVKGSLPPVAVAVGFGLLSSFIHRTSGLTQSFIGVAISMFIMGCLFLQFLWLYRSPWLVHFVRTAFRSKPANAMALQDNEA